MLKLSSEHILLEAIEGGAWKFTSFKLETMTSGDSRGLFREDPNALLTRAICRVRKFCQTAFNSIDGARRIIVRFLTLLRGVRDKSGAQLTLGDFAVIPSGLTTRRNSVTKLILEN